MKQNHFHAESVAPLMRKSKKTFKFSRIKPVEPEMLDKATVKMSIKKSSYLVKLFTPFFIEKDHQVTYIEIKIRSITHKTLSVGHLIKKLLKYVSRYS